MEEKSDFLKLSIEERCQHKLWKARVSGYEDAAKLFNQQNDEKSPEFDKYLELLKEFITDSNAIAQEKGLMAVLAFVENAACATKVVNDIMSELVSKCFSSPRAKTRELALEITFKCIEIEEQDVVLQELTQGLENKSPKIVSTCIVALRESLHQFGFQVIPLKPLVKVLPKLLEDRDKNVREDAKQLCVEIYRWVGEVLKIHLHTLKPFTLFELESKFQETAGERIAPTRYLKSLQEKVEGTKESFLHSTEVLEEAANFDSFDLLDAFDVLSKLPENFYEQCKAKKWKDRKEVLEILLQLTENVKLEPGDYGDLVRALEKILTKDSNVIVVGLAVKCLRNLIKGLRENFQPYATVVIPIVFEKLKEKNQNVVIPLREAIDGLFRICGFESMLEDIQSALDSKYLQIKAETCAFLSRAFSTCTAEQLNKKLLKALTASLLKTLNDADGTVREKSAEALGVALKVVGDYEMLYFLDEIQDIKKSKIMDFCDKALVQHPATSKQNPAPVVVKRASGKLKDSVPEQSTPEWAKEAPEGIKNLAYVVLAKSKGDASSAHSERCDGTKRGLVDADDQECKENELSDEHVMCQASSKILTNGVINGLDK